MSHVIIGAYEHDAFTPLLTLRLKDGEVVFEGDEELAKGLSLGVLADTGELITPKDGYAFLLAAARLFDHPSLMASEVLED